MDTQETDQWITVHKSKINQQYRLKYHLMGELGWINDPNGFSVYNGVYHLFYQFHPYNSKWGPMHWGHVTSIDLIKWDYQKIALAPDSVWDCNGCFSGSALVQDGQLYLFYTGHIEVGETYFQVQNLAQSNDGICFKKNIHNPIIGTGQIPKFAYKNDFRDPKIVFEEGIYYILVASKTEKNTGQILCYRSKNLLNWEYLNVFVKGCKELGEMWECPDLFKLEVLENIGEEKYQDIDYLSQQIDVLMISPQNMPNQGERYNNLHSSIFILGNSDLKTGVFNHNTYCEIDCGFDFYAPQTVTTSAGEVILIAWMDMWESPKPLNILDHGWTGAMTLPRVLTYKEGKIFANPVEAIKNYRGQEVSFNNVDIYGFIKLQGICGKCYELEIKLDLLDIESLVFSCYLRTNEEEYTLLKYQQDENSLILDRNHSGIGLSGIRKIAFDSKLDQLKLQIFVDISSVEVFVNDGGFTMTSRIFPSDNSLGIKFYTNQNYIIKNIKKWDIEI